MENYKDIKMITLKNTVAPNQKTNEDDILTLKKALHTTGDYKNPSYGMTPYPDRDLFKAVKKYQQRQNLKVDGIVRPNGETLLSLNALKAIPMAKSPIARCTTCGAPHGGSHGSECPDCANK
jgi:murein L,D-transpeptidase YcbB/YkuD